MFIITTKDIDTILHDFSISGKCVSFNELQRYHYEKENPSSKKVRLIVKVKLDNNRECVIRFKNEKNVTIDIVNDQSRFAVLLANNGIETPTVYSSEGQFARRYQIGEYDVIVTVENFVIGELQEVNIETAEKTGRLLARMHNIAETSDFHVQSKVIFDPLKENDLFSFEDFTVNKDYLVTIDKALYNNIIREHQLLLLQVQSLRKESKYAVQGDISINNLYRTASGNIGVFDFNLCGDNVLYFDSIMQAIYIARLMVYPKNLSEKHESVILPAFLKGYHQERPFTDKQKETFPYLYALISAFWLFDMKWDEHNIGKADPNDVHKWMKEIYNHIKNLPKMPV